MILRTRLFTKCAQPRLMAMVAGWWHNGISWERLESDLMQRMSNEELYDRCHVLVVKEEWRCEDTLMVTLTLNTEYLTSWRQKFKIAKEFSATYLCFHNEWGLRTLKIVVHVSPHVPWLQYTRTALHRCHRHTATALPTTALLSAVVPHHNTTAQVHCPGRRRWGG